MSDIKKLIGDFKDEYESLGFLKRSQDDQINRVNDFFEESVKPLLARPGADKDQVNSDIDSVRAAFNKKFSPRKESMSDAAYRMARVATGSAAEAALALPEAAIDIGAAAITGKPQKRESFGGRIKGALATPEEVEAEPGAAVAGSLAGTLLTPIPGAGGIKTILQGRAAAEIVGKKGLDKLRSQIVNIVDPTRTLPKSIGKKEAFGRLAGQASTFVGATESAEQLRKGEDLDVDKLAKDMFIGGIAGGTLFLGAKSIAGLMRARKDISQASRRKTGVTEKIDTEQEALEDATVSELDEWAGKEELSKVDWGDNVIDIKPHLKDITDELGISYKDDFDQVFESIGRTGNVTRLVPPTISGGSSNTLVQNVIDNLSAGKITNQQSTKQLRELFEKGRLTEEQFIKAKEDLPIPFKPKIMNKLETDKLADDFNMKADLESKPGLEPEVESLKPSLSPSKTGSHRAVGIKEFFKDEGGFLDTEALFSKELINNNLKSWGGYLQKQFARLESTFIRPFTVLDRVGFSRTANSVKNAIIEGNRFVAEIEAPILKALEKRGLMASDMSKIAEIADNVPIEDILKGQSTNPIWIKHSTDKELLAKTRLVARYFREGARRAGLKEDDLLTAYFPHIAEKDPDGWKIIQQQFRLSDPFFKHERSPGSELMSTDVLTAIKAYSAGVKRAILKNSEKDIDAAIGIANNTNNFRARTALNNLKQAMTRVNGLGMFDSVRRNFVENSLKFNFSSSLLNATQPLQTLLPEVGYGTLIDSYSLVKNPAIRKMISQLNIDDQLFSAYEIFNDIGGIAGNATKRISSLAQNDASVRFIKNFDLFSNVEASNQTIAAISGMIKKVGGSKNLMQILNSKMTRADENDLLMAAQEMIEKTQFSGAFRQVNRAGFENNQFSSTFLTFLNYPIREAGLLGTWALEIGSRDPMMKAQAIMKFSNYLGVKTLLAGQAGASVMIPSGLAWVIRENAPSFYNQVSDKFEFLDEFNLPAKLGLDLSESVGLLDPTQMAEFTLSKAPVAAAFGGAIKGISDLIGIGAEVLGGKPAKEVPLTKEEKLLTPEKKQKIFEEERFKTTTKSVGKIARLLPGLPAKQLGDKAVQIGTGQIFETIQSIQNSQSGRKTLLSQPLPTTAIEEAKRQFAPLPEDVARIQKPGLTKEASQMFSKGFIPSKETVKKLGLSSGSSREEVLDRIRENVQPDLLDSVALGARDVKYRKQGKEALKVLRKYLSDEDIEKALKSRIEPKGPGEKAQSNREERVNRIERGFNR